MSISRPALVLRAFSILTKLNSKTSAPRSALLTVPGSIPASRAKRFCDHPASRRRRLSFSLHLGISLLSASLPRESIEIKGIPASSQVFHRFRMLSTDVAWNRATSTAPPPHATRLAPTPARIRLRARPYGALSPFSISRRMASDREGFGSPCRSIQASIFASSSGGMRTPRMGWTPVRGRPRGLFCSTAIDPPLFSV